MDNCTSRLCTTVEIGRDKYKTDIRTENHSIISDEPEVVGGTDLGMDPTLLFISSLGACTAITLRMYADRKKWDVESISVVIEMNVVKSEQQQTSYINRHIRINGSISLEDKNRMLQIAEKCPIHQTMSNPIIITSNLLP